MSQIPHGGKTVTNKVKDSSQDPKGQTLEIDEPGAQSHLLQAVHHQAEKGRLGLEVMRAQGDEARKLRDAALSQRDEALQARETALSEREEALQARDEALSLREEAMNEREEALVASGQIEIWADRQHTLNRVFAFGVIVAVALCVLAILTGNVGWRWLAGICLIGALGGAVYVLRLPGRSTLHLVWQELPVPSEPEVVVKSEAVG